MKMILPVLVAATVGLLTLAILELAASRQRRLVARRMARLLGDGAAASGGRTAAVADLKTSALGWLLSLGERAVASRKNLDALRQKLAQAGYRGHSAVAAFFAIRTLLMLGLALLPFLVVPLVSDNAAATFLLLPYFMLPAWLAPRIWLQRKTQARQHELRRSLPDTLDLMIVCVEAGLGLNQALARVAAEIERLSPVMSAELHLVNLEIRAGTPRDESLRNLATRTGLDDLQAFVTMLIQADRFGTSIAQALRVQADALRTRRRQRAEEAAAKTTIKLVFPLVLFIFPALFVIILGPAVVAALSGG